MAPSKHNHAPPYAKDEKVLCFHGDLMYEAKIIDIRQTASTSSSSNNKDSSSKSGGSNNSADDVMYRVHYKGWKASWDDWVTADRIRKFTEDNKQLASQLKAQATMRTQGHHAHSKGGVAVPVSGKKGTGPSGKAGSEMSSARGSEERAAGSSSFASRGPRRGRDYELESVSSMICLLYPVLVLKLFLCVICPRVLLDLECLGIGIGIGIGSEYPGYSKIYAPDKGHSLSRIAPYVIRRERMTTRSGGAWYAYLSR